DAEVRWAMVELARHAADARDALVSGDAAAFGACMDASLEVRRRVMPLDARVLRMAEVARSFGACVNSAGSGGAIVGTAAGAGALDALRALGCGVVALRPGAAA